MADMNGDAHRAPEASHQRPTKVIRSSRVSDANSPVVPPTKTLRIPDSMRSSACCSTMLRLSPPSGEKGV